MNTAEAIRQSLSEPVIGKVEFGHQSFIDAFKDAKLPIWDGVQTLKPIEAQPSGLSEDNAVKVWVVLQAELNASFYATEEGTQSPERQLYDLLTARLIEIEKMVIANVPHRRTP